jgi:hypothetical protein
MSKIYSSYRSKVERGLIQRSRYQEILSDATFESAMNVTGR